MSIRTGSCSQETVSEHLVVNGHRGDNKTKGCPGRLERRDAGEPGSSMKAAPVRQRPVWRRREMAPAFLQESPVKEREADLLE